MVKKVDEIQWEAKEYIEYSHNTWWYVGLFGTGAVFCVLAFFLKWWTFIALVVLSIVSILVSASRPPRMIQYLLNNDGLFEGERLHKYEEFKAFGILKEGEHFSAVLIPKKRFGLQVKVYFPEKNGEAIVDALGARLPMEEVKLDFLDKIVSFLRI